MPLSAPISNYDNFNTGVLLSDTIALTMVAGRTYVLAVGTSVTNKLVVTVTDNLGGNTWIVAADRGQTACSTTLIACKAATGGSATVTITFDVATSSTNGYGVASSAELNTGASDQIGEAGGNGITVVSPETPTLSQANEIAFSCFQTAGDMGTFTPATGFTLVAPGQTYFKFEYDVVAATTAVIGGGSWITSRNAAAVVATWAGTIAQDHGPVVWDYSRFPPKPPVTS